MTNTFLASGDFCHLLITFANNLDIDQDLQNFGPDLDPNHLTLIWFLKEILDVYSFLASGDFCCLLITFANSLDIGSQ